MPSMQFAVGSAGMVVFRGKRFFCDILEIKEDLIRFHFPLADIPVEGLCASLEFHDDEGCTAYDAMVVRVSEEDGGSMVLRYSINCTRETHRAWWRIPGDFAMQVKHHVHPGLHWVSVNDISLGGVQVRTSTALAVGDTLDLLFTLPGFTESETVLAEVAYNSPEYVDDLGNRDVGLRYLCLDAKLRIRLKSYLWQRLRKLHPEDFSLGETPQRA